VTVYLVGAGPGDPDLLTVRAARLLSTADVIVVDRLVDRRALALAAPGTLVVDAGKAVGDDPGAAQARITAALIVHGRGQGTVVRLKGGDPYVFGRGTEELDALRDAGIEVEVVPGLSAAFAVPALAGVPVTERGVASSVTVASGHDVEGAVRVLLAASEESTVVLLMAVATRAAIAARAIAGGRAASTAVAVVERGATPSERRVRTTLGGLGSLEVVAPAVLVVGAVAARLEVGAVEDPRPPRTLASSAAGAEGARRRG